MGLGTQKKPPCKLGVARVVRELISSLLEVAVVLISCLVEVMKKDISMLEIVEEAVDEVIEVVIEGMVEEIVEEVVVVVVSQGEKLTTR